jgi:hypothetical protein
MNGIALTVLISQLPKLFGFSIDSDGLLHDLWHSAPGVLAGKTQLDHVQHWRRHAGRDPAAQAPPARAGHPDGGGGRHPHRGPGTWHAAAA